MADNARIDFWCETLGEALDAIGAYDKLTPEQKRAIAGWLASAAENMHMAFPSPSGPSQVERDLQAARRALAEERRKVTCRECHGIGSVALQGPSHCTISRCYKCNGEGRHAP